MFGVPDDMRTRKLPRFAPPRKGGTHTISLMGSIQLVNTNCPYSLWLIPFTPCAGH